MKLNILLIIVVVVFTGISCSESETSAPLNNNTGNTGTNNSDRWLLPSDQVVDGGPGKDGIPALEFPNFNTATEIDYLEEDDLVIGFKAGNDIRAYPHPILDWHEIINDNVGSTSVAITYCPLTGTAIGWNRVIDGEKTTFGVSGLLYNTNLIPYDRATDSNWSQIGLECVNGSLIETQVETMQVVETTWSTWKAMYPNSKVVTKNTGFSRNYDRYPYGSYKTDHNFFLFNVDPLDERLPSKERVLGVIIEEAVKTYRFVDFTGGTKVFKDTFKNNDLIIAGNKDKNFLVAYKNDFPEGVELTPINDNSKNIFKDSEGNTWNIFGEATSGDRKGEQLSEITAFIGMWFSFPAFYDEVVIYNK